MDAHQLDLSRVLPGSFSGDPQVSPRNDCLSPPPNLMRPYGTRTMRDEFTSNSFLAVAVAGLFLLCSGLLVLAFT